MLVSSPAFPPYGYRGSKFSSTTLISSTNAACIKKRGSSLALRPSDPGPTHLYHQSWLYLFAQARWETLSPDCCGVNMREGGRSQLYCSHALRAGSLVTLTTRLALLCCPVGLQGQVSCVLQLVWGRDSSLMLVTLGSSFSPITGSKR